MLRRKVAVLLVVFAAVGSGCSSEQQSDELMVTDNPVAAVAAVSPPAAATPAGTVTALADDVVAMAYSPESGTLAVAGRDTVRLYPFAETLGAPTTVDLTATSLMVHGRAFLAAGANKVTRVSAAGNTSEAGSFRGEPVSTAEFDGRTLVAVRDEKAVAVVEDAKVQRMISGDMMSTDQVLSAGEGAVVLDRLRNAVFELDVPGGTIAQGLRAGQGATNAVADRFGRVLVTDTRGGALLAFSLDPLLMRQNYPVPGAPYAITYDPERDLAWVTLTETNEVVGYDVAGEEPKEKYRFPTVSQPNTVAVDPRTGRVMVASGTGDGIQVIAI